MVFDKEKLKQAIKEHGIKNTEDLQDFLKKVTKDVIETLQEGEFTDHLGYEKYESRPDKKNARNGYSKKSVISNHGEMQLEATRKGGIRATRKVQLYGFYAVSVIDI